MFVIFLRLCQNLRLCTIFRQIWTIRGSDADVSNVELYVNPLQLFESSKQLKLIYLQFNIAHTRNGKQYP